MIMNGTRVTMFIGLTTKTGRTLDREETIKKIALALKRKYQIDGFTVVDGEGRWKGEVEKCLVVTVFTFVQHPWASFTQLLAQALEQEAILLAIEEIRGGCVFA